MKRRSDWLELALFGLSFVLMFAGTKLNFPVLTNLGIVSLGGFALVAGIQALRTRRFGFETSQRNFGPISLYNGLAAQLWGFIFIAIAILLFFLAGIAWLYPGGNEAFWTFFFGRSWGWGILLTCAGLVVMVGGIITLISGSAGYYQGLADKVQRISGVIPLAIGSVVAVIGLSLLIFPDWLAGIAHAIIQFIGQRLFH